MAGVNIDCEPIHYNSYICKTDGLVILGPYLENGENVYYYAKESDAIECSIGVDAGQIYVCDIYPGNSNLRAIHEYCAWSETNLAPPLICKYLLPDSEREYGVINDCSFFSLNAWGTINGMHSDFDSGYIYACWTHVSEREIATNLINGVKNLIAAIANFQW